LTMFVIGCGSLTDFASWSTTWNMYLSFIYTVYTYTYMYSQWLYCSHRSTACQSLKLIKVNRVFALAYLMEVHGRALVLMCSPLGWRVATGSIEFLRAPVVIRRP
jgi:hypothetical protein